MAILKTLSKPFITVVVAEAAKLTPAAIFNGPAMVVEPVLDMEKSDTLAPAEVVEPIVNVRRLVVVAACMENCAKGEEVPIPTCPFWLTPVTMNEGVVEPWLDTTNEGLRLPCSTESLPHGVEEPIPISPAGEERVETEKMG